MRILLDECVPRPIRRQLTGHVVATVPEVGWSGKRNGELLGLMAGRYDVFLTADQNLRFQHDLSSAGVAVVILVASSNRLADLMPLMPDVNARLLTLAPGDIVEIRRP